MVAAIDWEPIADHLGFGSPYEMFTTLLDENNHETNSLRKLNEYLGVSIEAIQRCLKKLDIKARSRTTYACRKGIYYDKTNRLLARREVLRDLTARQIVERFGLKDINQFYCLARHHKIDYKRKNPI